METFLHERTPDNGKYTHKEGVTINADQRKFIKRILTIVGLKSVNL